MKPLVSCRPILFGFLTLLWPLAGEAVPWMGGLRIRDSQVWPDGRPGNYGIVKYFLDETAAETVPIEVSVHVFADGRPPGDLEVEVYSNVNRRDFAKIHESPAEAGGATSYYRSYPMTFERTEGNNHLYKVPITLSKTGAYRLTTRFRIQNGAWLWHNDFEADGRKQRDCAVMISPKKVLTLSMYEANPLVVEASPGGNSGHRSSLEDFTDRDTDGFDPFNLGFIKNTLGFNVLWLMPVFPNTKERWSPEQNQWIANHSPGSPYAARNYFAISPTLSESDDPADALSEFQHLVKSAEDLKLDVFIDVAFNHAGRDVVFGQGAVDLGLVPASQRDSLVRTTRPSWGTKGQGYREHAASENELALYAPVDRFGEHRWFDAGMDWFFGNYSSLGPKPGFENSPAGGAEDERDLMYSDLDPDGGHDFEVENVWNYFARILSYWLDQTNNRLDGIRADFAQGLPPQAWEYIINKTRQKKWDFVFLAEALDPDTIRYRVNRHFDLITTVNHAHYRSNDVTMSDLAGSLEGEANLYGYNAAVLHNGTSHDEEGNGNRWLMAARYTIAAGMYGVPMVYMGQPLGIPHKIDFQYGWESIKSSWDAHDPAIFAFYKRVNSQREKQPAFRSTHRYFLGRQASGGFNNDIFSAARWSGDNVVLLFTNLRNAVVGPETFAIPPVLPLDPNANYQAVNLLADNPNQTLWPAPRSGADIRQNGVFVQFSLPNESQWLLLQKQ